MHDSALIDQLPADRVVAFVDILGFRDVLRRIFRDSDVALYGRIRKALNRISGHASWANRPLFGADDEIPHTARATAFSDSIVFSDEFTDIGVSSVASKVAFLATWLLRDGILCRGAIASGPTLHDDRILLGEGLVKAYELESSAAIYPRIILSAPIGSMVQEWPLLRTRVDIDGFRFIDPFYGLQKAHVEDFLLTNVFNPPEWDRVQFQVVAKHIAASLRDLQRAGESVAGPLAKWRWFASWFDIAAREYVGTSYEELLREAEGNV